MLKTILNLDGAQELGKKELKAVQGGYACRLEMDGSYSCPSGTICCNGMCGTPDSRWCS